MRMRPGKVIWITGLSGAGKTTLAKAVSARLTESCILLDGDDMRQALVLLAGGYDYESRKKLALTYSRLCKLLAEQGAIVICATISMFKDVHDWNRANLPGYTEVYLQASEVLRKKRDKKNIYSCGNYLSSTPVAGSDFDVEFPESPDILIEQDTCGFEESINVILTHISAS